MFALQFKPTITRYVRVPVELSRRDKVTKEQSERMKLLREQGKSWNSIAAEFGVAKTTVMRHVSSLFRYKENLRATKYSKERRATDPEYAQRHKELSQQSKKRLIADFPPHRQYYNHKNGHFYKK